MKGPQTKLLAVLGIALMLVNLPCLAACMACPTQAPVPAPSCHHKAPVHPDSQQPCPHQLFRATAPTTKAPDAPADQLNGWASLPESDEPASAPSVAVLDPPGLSPPRHDLAPLVPLRV